MAEPIVIHAETCNGDKYEIRYYRASDYDALAAENAALRKDVERYRWLASQFRNLNVDMGGNHAWSYGHHVRLRGPTIDAAIDAAMGEKP